MNRQWWIEVVGVLALAGSTWAAAAEPDANPSRPFGYRQLDRVPYNNPGFVVDLGVGLWAWPLPMDFDGDGDLDLVVSCNDKPYNGTYFFENCGPDPKFPVFRPGKWIGVGQANVQVSYVDGLAVVLTPGTIHPEFKTKGLEAGEKLPVQLKDVHPNKVRANQWKLVDYDGDGLLDIIVGVGDWTDYGWDDAFNELGEWTRGPLHGLVYFVRNLGPKEQPRYAAAVKVMAGDKPVDVFGMPSPNFADFDGDGDLDLLCGEFVDTLTYFENVGTRQKPSYAAGRKILLDGQPLRMDLCMIDPVAIDWDRDGDMDLVVGQEDGRVALLEHTGKVEKGLPVFAAPHWFQQQAENLKFGALVSPESVDWDGDGDEDLICGNSAGYIGFIENLDGGVPPRWAAPRYLEADGEVIRILAGPNGSIQGPCEAKWGYTTLSVADWDHDGLPDLVVNSIWGKVLWYRNTGTRQKPVLAAAAPIQVQWPGKPPKPQWFWWDPQDKDLVTQWRTRPVVYDVNGDGLNDLVMLDQEGYLCWFQRQSAAGKLLLLPPQRVFYGAGRAAFDGKGSAEGAQASFAPLQLNTGRAGRSGRRKFCIADWDLDGRFDLLLNSRNVSFFRNIEVDLRHSRLPEGTIVFSDLGLVSDRHLAGHDTSPTTVDWNKDGVRDLLVGGEDGHFYYMLNPFQQRKAVTPGPLDKHLVVVWDFESTGPGPLADKAPAGVAADTLEALGAVAVEKGAARVPASRGAAFQAHSSDDLSPDRELTLWARIRVSQTPRGLPSLIDKRRFKDPEARSYGMYLTSDPKQGRDTFGLGGQVSANGTGKASASDAKSEKALPCGQWCQVAMIVRNRDGRLVVEWYGRVDEPGQTTPWTLLNGPVSTADVNSIYRSNEPLLLGNTHSLGQPSTPIDYDEVRFYDRALTADEMNALTSKP